jgi:AMMECR1 domain-containing protein
MRAMGIRDKPIAPRSPLSLSEIRSGHNGGAIRQGWGKGTMLPTVTCLSDTWLNETFTGHFP